VRLGQSSTTLSSGEAQRMKLAAELFRADSAGRAVVVLDEPSTGLSAGDLVHLARVLDRLAARGDAVIVVEHNTQLLSVCDTLVELGPGRGGEAGGRIVAAGTPREVAADRARSPVRSSRRAGARGAPRRRTRRRAEELAS
jgi:excinuclease ABC subunit A